ncbi:tetratricopeptide repeat protein [Pelosinus sp. UFO1]|uniref:tetratricopeptide repeat protein n=1 Tax=Pelosinus sp. UFO1 TaxID=484770 RepID=UPI0004D1B467|nr:tetratricopeptide repeat protein [Pelosinus sp. UFO1]AIF49608.1 hypothetical protein UFO1_0047 [Pelosinus sp. UFO1]
MNAQSHFNSGVEAAHKGDALQAIEFFRQAILLKSDYAEAYNAIGALLINMNNLNQAEFYLQRAIECKENYYEALYNLGTLFNKTGLLYEAEICLREAINLDSNFPEAHFRLGMVLKQLERLEEAETHLCKAIELRPNFKEADFALGILYLLQGQYEKGWKRYELRRQIFDSFDPGLRHWKIEDLIGEKVVLFHEQGFGDTIHFSRYVKEIAKVAAEVILLVPKQLERIMSSSLKNITIHSDEKMVGEYKFSYPLPTLPFLFNTTLHTIPKSIPYIKVNNDVIEKWRNIVEKEINVNNYKVGVVWAGNPNHKNDRNRSIPFSTFKPIFSIKAVNWISLQIDDRVNELQTISDEVLDFHEYINDFSETAGLIENINLVITVDTAVAHLAGAMGKETWLLLPMDPDWRWQIQRQDSPWYPTIRIFRQLHIGDWQEVLARVTVALEAKLKK